MFTNLGLRKGENPINTAIPTEISFFVSILNIKYILSINLITYN